MKRILIFLLSMFVLSAPASANDVRDWPLEQKIEKSDIVVTGIAESQQAEADGFTYATIRTATVLKGNPEPTFRLQVSGSIAEFDVKCCDIGKLYVFMLYRSKGGYYASVNGRYGVYLAQK
jgi:hypothetical protein